MSGVQVVSISLIIAVVLAATTVLLVQRLRQNSRPDPYAGLTREQLEEEKLRLELSDLRYTWRRTSSTTLVTLVLTFLIAAGGWTVQRLSEDAAHSQAEQEHQDQLFAKALENFGSANPAARAGAAFSLQGFALGTSDRSRAATTVLVYRFSDENDPAAFQALVDSAAGLQKSSLPLLLSSNELAASRFAHAAGRYVGYTMQAMHTAKDPIKIDPLADEPVRITEIQRMFPGIVFLDADRNNAVASNIVIPTILSAVDRKVLTSIDPLQRRFSLDRFFEDPLNSNRFLRGHAFHDAFANEARGAYLESEDAGRLRRDMAASLQESVRYGRAILGTSIAVGAIFAGSSGDVEQTATLNEAVLVGINLRNGLRGITDCSNAYISGIAAGANLRACDFSDTDLAFLELSAADLTDADLCRTTFPDLRYAEVNALPKLRNTNAKKADLLSADELMSGFPRGTRYDYSDSPGAKWLARQYGDTRTGEERQRWLHLHPNSDCPI